MEHPSRFSVNPLLSWFLFFILFLLQDNTYLNPKTKSRNKLPLASSSWASNMTKGTSQTLDTAKVMSQTPTQGVFFPVEAQHLADPFLVSQNSCLELGAGGSCL
jgi:hypothetical protein